MHLNVLPYPFRPDAGPVSPSSSEDGWLGDDDPDQSLAL